ncbi:MAG: hypothetical protein QME90_08670 [Thermodesulfobacteriota bacterium]|nr:hypothetical protein [Thermodesulfobacteriota bacterium]
MVLFLMFQDSKICLAKQEEIEGVRVLDSVVPVLARQSASARRRENGNSEKTNEFLLEFAPNPIWGGMDKKA